MTKSTFSRNVRLQLSYLSLLSDKVQVLANSFLCYAYFYFLNVSLRIK